MWVRVLLSLLHVMHVAGGVNFMSLLLMNVYCIYLLAWFDKKGENFFWVYLCPFVNDLTKRGREIWRFIYVYLFHFLVLYKKGEKDFESFVYAYMFCLCKKGRRIWWVDACLSPYLCIHFCLVLYTLLNILLFIVMHELRGSFYEA